MYCVCMYCVYVLCVYVMCVYTVCVCDVCLRTHSCHHMHVKVKGQLLGRGSRLSLWLPGIKLSVFPPGPSANLCLFSAFYIHTVQQRNGSC